MSKKTNIVSVSLKHCLGWALLFRKILEGLNKKVNSYFLEESLEIAVIRSTKRETAITTTPNIAKPILS